MTLSVIDLFCGADGSSHGAELADFQAECQGVYGG
jgi:site-specific DNA-cytosine methylase